MLLFNNYCCGMFWPPFLAIFMELMVCLMYAVCVSNYLVVVQRIHS